MIGFNAKGKQGVLVGREGKRVFSEEVQTITAAEQKSTRYSCFQDFFYLTLNVQRRYN